MISRITRFTPLLLLVGLVVAMAFSIWQQRILTMRNKHERIPGQVRYSKTGHDITPLTQEQIDALAQGLTPEEAHIILRKGTERPFCGLLNDQAEPGTYICRLCGLPLFSSDSKFKSGTGWPSFFQPVDSDHVHTEHDDGYGMVRTEILCMRCGGHLGHVFEDGPRPTGLRFCVNSASLTFHKDGSPLPNRSLPVAAETAYFAGGCFWGIEDAFGQLPGVLDSVSGYMGGKTKNPTYKEVCYTDTGHAETVEVKFDPARLSYEKLLEWFFKIHDPTQLNRQGPDVGSQYRSAIFTVGGRQQEAARLFLEAQAKTSRFEDRKIVTQLLSADEAGPFYRAEEYHQDYHQKHGGSCALPSR
jgi:peptide methionine sulfoxide reductase msrA/msrB